MPIVTFRVSEEMREDMKKVNVNWASYLREAVAGKLREEMLKKACKAMDESRAKTRGVRFDSVKIIRELRDSR